MQYVYLMKAGKQLYKVGITHNVSQRLSQLQMVYPEKIEVVCSKYADTKAYTIEQEIHAKLVQMKAGGANEWFILTPDQAIEVAITINKYPDIDISEKASLAKMVQLQRTQQKIIEKKLTYVIDTYQKLRIPKQVFEPRPIKPVEIDITPPKQTPEESDEQLYKSVLYVLKEADKASTSLLQRKLRIGYGRAARLIEELEEKHLISMMDGSRPRSVMREALQEEINKISGIQKDPSLLGEA